MDKIVGTAALKEHAVSLQFLSLARTKLIQPHYAELELHHCKIANYDFIS